MTRWCIALIVVGCGGEEPTGSYIDRLPGADPWLAITVEGEQAAAFVCGGSETLTTHTRWMTTTVDGSDLRFEEDGFILEVEAADDRLTGSLLSPDGVSLPIAAGRPSDPLAGLYTAVDSGCRAGVIIASSSEAQGAWCDSLDNFSQVTPLSPIELEAEGIEVTATDAPGGPRTFFVKPASPAEIAAGP